jgi:hypothetical protein
MPKLNLENGMAELETEALGALIDRLTELKVQRSYHEKQSEKLTAEMTQVEADIIHAMAEQHLEQAAHGGTKVVPKDHTYPHVEDWAKFYEFIKRENYMHLLIKRVSETGYRELLDLGREVPGVVPFVKTKLSVTKSVR